MTVGRVIDHAFLLLALLGAVLLVLKRELLIPSPRARWALRLGFGAWALLWLSATPAVSNALVRALEPAQPSPDSVAPLALRSQTALVVLGSSIYPPVPGVPPRDRLDAAARARANGAALWFHRTQPAAVIVTGEAPGPNPGAAAEAMADALVAAGVPRGRIWLEPRATNTRENARLGVELGRTRGMTRFVVVTSALHMGRALREFRRVGVEPVAAPVDYVGRTFGGPAELFPSSQSLGRTQQALHELLGLLKP